MPFFDYQAATAGGKPAKGRIDAASEADAMTRLRAEGKYPVSIRPVSTGESALPSLGVRIPGRRLAAFCLQLSAMLGAGVSLEPALGMCSRQTEDKRLRAAADEALEAIRGGSSLLEAFKKQKGRFPDMFLNMVEAGEASGTLDVCLKRAGEWLTRSAKLSAKVRGALMYPVFILTLTVTILTFMMIFVIPQFVGLYEKRGAELPLLTSVMIALSNGIRSHGVYILLGAAVLFALWRFRLMSESGRIAHDRRKLRTPLFGKLTATVMAARFARTMSTLCGAGVPLTRALDVAGRALGNSYGQKKIGEVISAVQNGQSISEPLEKTGLFPPLLIHMTYMGEESGKLEELLDQAAGFFEDESDVVTKRLITLLEPAMIVIMGGLVLLIVLAIIVPMFNMYSLI